MALVAHHLLSAPLPPPSPSDWEDQTKPKKKHNNSYGTTQQYQYTPEYTTVFEEDFTAQKISGYSSTPNPVYSSSIPFYRSTSFVGDQAYTSPSPGYSATNIPVSEFSRIPAYSSTVLPVSGYTSPKPGYATSDPRPRPSGFTTASLLSGGFSISPALGPSTARYLESSNKYAETPVDDYGYTNGGLSHEPSYFTREYLLESPVTKTYDGKFLLSTCHLSPPLDVELFKLATSAIFAKLPFTLQY